MTNGLQARDLSAEVADASAKVAQLQRDQTRAEAMAAAAQDEYERALARLLADFGVDSPEAAQELLAELDRQVAAELDVVRTQLAEAGG